MSKALGLIRTLRERWKGTIVAKDPNFGVDRTYEIFLNPTSSELRDIEQDSVYSYEGVRFLADPKEKYVYVWSSSVLHHTVFEKLGLSDDHARKKQWAGFGEINRGVIYPDDYLVEGASLAEELRISQELENGDYDFMERYGFNLIAVKR